MDIQQIPQNIPVQQKSLPRLIKQSSTYKLHVPKQVEEKIRYLCRKFPTLEWSGVLFTTYTGNFEDGNLKITCEDLFPMDLGSSTYTQFKMDESVAAYMAQNPELFDCDLNLLHSHNNFSCFFSGTDLSTLQSEGDDQNCFISLIVNNAGTYCAAITRKKKCKKTITTAISNSSYEFFGEGSVLSGSATENTQEHEETVIEYFMLDVEIEQVDNPLAYLDDRFNAIEAKKRKLYQPTPNMPSLPASRIVSPKWEEDGSLAKSKISEDEEFYDWMHSERKKAAEAKESLLFSEEEIGDIDPAKWQPDPIVIHHMIVILITCSFIVSDKIDLKQWIHTHMVKKYNSIFISEEMFTEWKDFIIEFLMMHYACKMDIPDVLIDDYDTWQSKIAEAMVDELGDYPTNGYIEQYSNHLMEYIIPQ